MATVKAYKIGVNFVANTTNLKTPLAGVSKTLSTIENKQARVNKQFTAMRDAIQSTLIPAQKLADTMSVIANASMHLTSGARTLKRVTMNVNQAAPAPSSALRGGVRGGSPNSYVSPGRVNLPPAPPVNPLLGNNTSTRAMPNAANSAGLGAMLGMATLGPEISGPAVGGYRGTGASMAYSGASPGRTGYYTPNMLGLGGGRQVTPLSQAPRASFGRRLRFGAGRIGQGAARIGQGAARAGAAYWQHRISQPQGTNTLLHLLEGYEAFRFLEESMMLHGSIDQSLIMAAGPQDDNGKTQGALRGIVYGLSSSNPYISRAAAATLTSEAFNTSGYKIDELKSLLPVYSDAYTAYSAMGKGETALEDTRKLINGFDIMGDAYNKKGEVDVNKLRSFVDAGLKMSLIDRFNFKASSVRPFAVAAKSAGRGLSYKGFQELAPLIALDPSGIGTAINSLQNLAQGRKGGLFSRNAKILQALGVLDKNGRFKDLEMLEHTPVEWVDKYYTGKSASYKADFLSAMQRQTVRGFSTNVDSFKGNIVKTVNALEGTSLADTVGRLKKDTPQAALARLSTSWDNLKDSIGAFATGPGIKIMDKLAEVIRKITKELDTNPKKWQSMADNIGKLVMFMIQSASAIGAIVKDLPVDRILKILAAIAGGSAGTKLGMTVGMALAPVVGPEAVPIAAAAGGAIGAIGGYSAANRVLNPPPAGQKTDGTMGVPNMHWEQRGALYTLVPDKPQASTSAVVINTHIDGQQVAQHVEHIQRRKLLWDGDSNMSGYDHTQNRMRGMAGAY